MSLFTVRSSNTKIAFLGNLIALITDIFTNEFDWRLECEQLLTMRKGETLKHKHCRQLLHYMANNDKINIIILFYLGNRHYQLIGERCLSSSQSVINVSLNSLRHLCRLVNRKSQTLA